MPKPNRLFKLKVVVSNQQFCNDNLVKSMRFMYISLIYKNSNLHSSEKKLIFFHNKWMEVQQPTLSLRTCQIHRAGKHIGRKVSFKVTLCNRYDYIWHMFTFQHKYKDVIVQNITFSSKAHDQCMEGRNYTSLWTQYSFRIPFIRK